MTLNNASSPALPNVDKQNFLVPLSRSKNFNSIHCRHTSTPSTSLNPYIEEICGTERVKSFISLRGLLSSTNNKNDLVNNYQNSVNSSLKHDTLKNDNQNSNDETHINSTSNIITTSQKIGEMRLKLWYNVDKLLPLEHYQLLYLNLINSLYVQPYSASLTSILQYLPIDMEKIAKSLMKIFVYANQIRPFFRLICTQYVSSIHDVNTLFRSQSMTSKIMFELMKFVGHDYLVISLKPLIDLIYAERKCCEIDPIKIKPSDSLEQNLRNITVYAELAFSRVVDSSCKCPDVLRGVFAELKTVVKEKFPAREDVAHLALSSFLIMRFFAAAILNPKSFSLKREAPDAEVSRTLVLVSKILQRLSNCVVSAHPLTTKEQWLTPVLLRFSDHTHKTSMISFLDSVSNISSLNNDCTKNDLNNINNKNISSTLQKLFDDKKNKENDETTNQRYPLLLKHGHMIERRCGSDKKKSFKNFIHQKRRYVTLTETQLCWQKVKDYNVSVADLQKQSTENIPSTAQLEHKGHFQLSEITSVSPLSDAKNSFRVATPFSEVHFQASSASEMNEWLILIQKQQRRHIMLLNRLSNDFVNNDYLNDSFINKIDMEREMQVMHLIFSDNYDTLCRWKNILECEKNVILQQFYQQNGQISNSTTSSSRDDENIKTLYNVLPLDKLFQNLQTVSEREDCLSKFYDTLVSTIILVQQIQNAHQTAQNVSYQMKLQRQNVIYSNIVRNDKKSSSNDQEVSNTDKINNKNLHNDVLPDLSELVTNDNKLPLNIVSTLNNETLIDNENYLHLESDYKRIKKNVPAMF